MQNIFQILQPSQPHYDSWRKKASHLLYLDGYRPFHQLTNALVSTTCMAYFDTHKVTMVTVDASPVLVSAILSQKSKEKDYVKLLLMPAWLTWKNDIPKLKRKLFRLFIGVEHFHLYLYGHEFLLITNHKPLEVIFGNNKSKTSARIKRWVLRLQPYSFKVLYKPGVNNPTDYLSCHPASHSLKQQNMTEEHVNFIAYNSVPNRGVRRIRLTSLNPKVCPNNQSEVKSIKVYLLHH